MRSTTTAPTQASTSTLIDIDRLTRAATGVTGV